MVQDNILIEFEFLADLDLAVFRYVNHHRSQFNIKDFINTKDVNQVISTLINRQEECPLDIMIDDPRSAEIFDSLVKNDNLLPFTTIYDTFGLLINFLKATKHKFTILCTTRGQADFMSKLIATLDNKPNIFLVKDKTNIDPDNYSIMYIKLFRSLLNYQYMKGKTIYIADANYNRSMHDNSLIINPDLVLAFGDINTIKMIKMYITATN